MSKKQAAQLQQEEKRLIAKIEAAPPVDFSFKNIRSLKSVPPVEAVRTSRVGEPEIDPASRKFLTKSIWLNNNKLKNIVHVDALVDSLLERPELLGWLDFSFNYITQIDDAITKCQNLKILYFHGNCIYDLDELYKLRALTKLKSVTFHGNPISNLPGYRRYVIGLIAELVNLDFAPVLGDEKGLAPPPELTKRIKEDAMRKK